jgi:aspartate carbamoyltransferase catalytic subunit
MRKRSLLDLDDLSAGELTHVLDLAERFAENPPPRDLLRDVCVVNLFFEASTRTYVSFAIAEQRVGADVIALPPGSSSLGKGETVADTAVTLAAMGVRVIVTRHPESGFPYRVAESFDGHVINAGDGRHAHPTQALLDLLTLRAEFGRIAGLRIAIVGDVMHSRVARSNVSACAHSEPTSCSSGRPRCSRPRWTGPAFAWRAASTRSCRTSTP